MSYTTVTKNKNKVSSIKTKVEKFEGKINNIQDFIDNHKSVSEDEAELLKLSFETLLSFIDNKSKDL